MDPVAGPSFLAHEESAELLPHLASAIVGSTGWRALLIKGAAANHHGVRRRRLSSDVDLLVDPAGFVAAVDAFVAHGWTVGGEMSRRRLTEVVSVTLTHPLWPQPVDLQRRFVGFAAADDVVFEQLWADRVQLHLAHRDVAAAGPASAVLVQALHALRDPHLVRSRELDDCVAWLAAAAPGTQKGVARLARAIGAAETALPLFDRAGLEAPTPDPAIRDAARLRAYRLRVDRQENFAVDYLEGFLSAPLRRWPLLMLRLVAGDDYALRRRYPDLPEGRRWLWVARWRRMRALARMAPAAIRIRRRHRIRRSRSL